MFEQRITLCHFVRYNCWVQLLLNVIDSLLSHTHEIDEYWNFCVFFYLLVVPHNNLFLIPSPSLTQSFSVSRTTRNRKKKKHRAIAQYLRMIQLCFTLFTVYFPCVSVSKCIKITMAVDEKDRFDIFFHSLFRHRCAP